MRLDQSFLTETLEKVGVQYLFRTEKYRKSQISEWGYEPPNVPSLGGVIFIGSPFLHFLISETGSKLANTDLNNHFLTSPDRACSIIHFFTVDFHLNFCLIRQSQHTWEVQSHRGPVSFVGWQVKRLSVEFKV